jgi:membrane protease YdiL (CAAX protease family)
MAHIATKRFNYWGQMGILLSLCGGGLIIGGLASFIPLLGKIDFLGKSNPTALMDSILKPENAAALRWSQVISTIFLFFLPPVLYARICHVKAFTHLGFNTDLQEKKPVIETVFLQIVIVIVIMLASLPAVSALQELTEMLPWSKATLLQFKVAEDSYNKQIAVIARMNDFSDYLISVAVVALLPAVFEEILFRGAIQNLLSRWIKMPVLAIVITAIIFSAIHGSYLGFLSRFALGFVLGWIFYRTGNIWLNIIGHFFNNAMALTVLYITSKPGEKIDPSKMEDHFPLWVGLASVAIVVGLFLVFEKISKNSNDRPGEEVLIPGYNFNNNPFENDIVSIGKNTES